MVSAQELNPMSKGQVEPNFWRLTTAGDPFVSWENIVETLENITLIPTS